ncbi:zinc finger, C2H2 type [Dictyocaulus viviparus]|uniref:Zinc finger, C2H2 type n=1 Tax=Dictyocaulus viviparus TaxID=29172 RepID=A0A0D8Y1R7_DICVI|nr:zinc finger, C2H2 type [Dictyocaulus viviparus]
MHPPSSPLSMQEVVSSSGQQLHNHQHSLMQRLLMGAGNGSGNTHTSSARNGIEDIAARLHKQNGSTSISMGGNGYYSTDLMSSWGDHLSISNNTPMMHLTCLECGINKNNSEDMEVHLKREHLNWLPFQCPICLSERASDAEMREHLHSSHRKNMNKAGFIYVDNVTAKRSLQIMMDRALSHAMSRRSNHGSGRISSSTTISPPAAAVNHLAVAIKAQDKLPSLERSRTSPTEVPVANLTASRKRHLDESLSTGNTNTDALLASISRATNSGIIEGEVSDDLELIPIFNNKRIKSEFDVDHEHDDSSMVDDSILDNLNPISVLDNVAALFASDGRIEDTCTEPHSEKPSKSQSAKALSSAISKKRVLGECSKCQKPVTAGARQMHMFFHLAKDHGTFRFRCLFEGCTVEHYRKDQMENHQSKIHGKIDPEMMEDRSLELFHRCQELNHELFLAHKGNANSSTPAAVATKVPSENELSMELLGTKNGSTPGPTAAKAEATYNAQIAAQKEKSNKTVPTPIPKPVPVAAVMPRAVPDEEHPLECRLCHKTMQNRIRGFHILWHMAKDMGINRYICRICGFGHDRSQSVQVHGKKEHGSEDVVQDRIGEYSDEVKQMSEQCFGFQALFAQENKRRSKIPSATPLKPRKSSDDDDFVDDLTLDLDQNGEGDLDDFEVTLEHEPDDYQEPFEDEEEERDTSVAVKSKSRKRQSRFPRFGLRRPKSKSKRTEMARLREISMLLGGAQYFKKKLSEAAHCEKCGKITNSRMSEHAYTHMEEHLFLCPHCDLGHQSRELVMRHIREIHETDDRPVDNRLKHARDIKAMIRECYPAYFVDAPIPTQQDIEKLWLGHDDEEPGEDEYAE